MSVSGPCLWMPSLSPPISSHISAVSAHFSPARDGQYLQPKPVSVSPTLLRSWEQGSTPSNEPRVEMQQAALKAENALPSAASAGKPGQQCAETDTPLGGVETSNPRNRTDPRLTRMRLPKLDCSEPLLSKHRGGNLHTESPLDSGGGPRDETQDRVNEDSETSPSDGGMGSSAGAEQQKTPAEIKADKKKMKRFR